ncbi:putative Zinc finger, RING-CH-type, Zinc finger, RING/FYVE/PHD-type [Helianthus anomalus]
MEITPEVVTAHDEIGQASTVNAPPSPSASLSMSEGNMSSLSIPFDDDIDADVCRICRLTGGIDNPLQYPCACSGSIKFIHRDCLFKWLNTISARHCEICKLPYSFTRVYAENTPARLPFQVLQYLLRLSCLLLIWLMVIPSTTSWVWRFSYVRSYGEAQRLFLNRIAITDIVTDCFHGILLSACIMYVFLRSTFLRDSFRHLREIGEAQEIAGVGQMIRRFAGHVAAKWEMHAARLEQMFYGLDDGDGAEYFIHLVENAFTVLACNMIFLGVGIFVPFHLGQFVLYHSSSMLSSTTTPVQATLKNLLTSVTNSDNKVTIPLSSDIIEGVLSRLLDITTLVVGYVIIFYGIVSIVGTVPSLFGQFLAKMRHSMTMIKVAFLLVIELGAFPLMWGWWLDFCTLRMFEKSMSQRVEFFSSSPLISSSIHWVVGIAYLLLISGFVNLLREVLRNGVLYFLPDPADPDYNMFQIDDPVHKNACRVLILVIAHGSLIVMLVFLPVKLAMHMASSVFPLNIPVSDSTHLLHLGICILQAFDLLQHPPLKATIKSLLRYWFTSIGGALGLTDFLLRSPEDDNGQENGQLGGQDRAVADANLAERCKFVLRIVLLLLAAWMTLLIFNSAIIVVPILVGRAWLRPLPFEQNNDLGSFIVGSCIIVAAVLCVRCLIGVIKFLTALVSVRYSIDRFEIRRATVLLRQIMKWFFIVVKSSALLSIGIFMIPVMIGLLLELLIVVPLLVPVDESPVLQLYRSWPFGLLFLHMWTQRVTINHLLHPVDDDSWGAKLERVIDDGFSRLQGFWVLWEILVPIVMKLLTALCFPYVLAKGVFPAFGYPLAVNSAVYRFAWLGCLGFTLLCFCVKRFLVWLTNIHSLIRDSLYVIGRTLNNFEET